MRITLRSPPGSWGWLCSNSTLALVPLVPVTVNASPVKIVVLQRKNGRVSRLDVRLFDIVAAPAAASRQLKFSGYALEVSNGSLVDITPQFVRRAHKLVDATNAKFAAFFAKLKKTARCRSSRDAGYMHKYMIEMDLPRNMPVPIVCGHPLIRDGLREWSDMAVLRSFQQCLIAAKQATSFSAAAVVNAAATKECLYVAALRMFAGVYHTKEESEDDRTMPAVSLYTNHDCDDMALCCTALAMRLSKLHVSGGHPYGAGDLISSVRPAGAYIAQGLTFQGGGHTWAALRMPDNRLLHLECTQLFAPHAGTLSDNYGSGVFAERARLNMDTDIFGIKALDTTMYKTLCVLYTADHMYIPCIAGYMATDYSSFLQNKCTLVEVPIDVAPDPLICTLRATPGPAEIAKIIDSAHGAYAMVYSNCHPTSAISSNGSGFKKVGHDCGQCFTISPGNALSAV